MHQKIKSIKTLLCSQLQAKDLVIKKKEEENNDGPVSFFAIKCKCRATYDFNVEAISFAIG